MVLIGIMGGLLWALLGFSLVFSLWYNYKHFKRLLDGNISLREEIITLGSIFVTIVLFVILVITRLF